MEYRSVAYVQLVELSLSAGDLTEAVRYARFALDYDRHNISALQVLALVARKIGDRNLASKVHEQILENDPLDHFVEAERLLSTAGSSTANLMDGLRSEYPDQSILELAVDYHRRGSGDDASTLLSSVGEVFGNPLLRVWQG